MLYIKKTYTIIKEMKFDKLKSEPTHLLVMINNKRGNKKDKLLNTNSIIKNSSTLSIKEKSYGQ